MEIASISPFWFWAAATCILLAVELLIAPTGFFLCLGTSAGALAALSFFLPDMTWLWMLGIYAVLSVIACVFWLFVMRRKKIQGAEQEDDSLSLRARQLLGYRAVLEEDTTAGRGRIRVNDSPWRVEADRDYPAGTLVEVTEVRGVTLKVRAVEA